MASYLALLSNIVVIAVLGFIVFRVIRYFGTKLIHSIANKTKTVFDDILVENKVFLNLSRIFIFTVLHALLPMLLQDFTEALVYVERIVNIITLVATLWFINSVLSSIKDFLRGFPAFKDKPLESYVQIFMVILWSIAIIMSFSILTGKPLLKFFTALGAFSAVLLLIFKDTILGFVASIQISVYDTVRLNDWITMSKYGADGNVIEINLTSVIVKNFDNTVTSIPTYSLISESFKNWRAMSASGGRRIKRSVLIKINSIGFLSSEDIEELEKIELIKHYIKEISTEVDAYNRLNSIDKSLLINGRNLTNLGVFRKYLEAYLGQHPKINQDLLFMTRQLEPTPQGIPLEVYAFSSNKQWQEYERIMADIFDHVLASVSYFKLEVFEHPSSKDVLLLKETIRG